MIIVVALFVLIVINGLTAVLFAVDKRRAINGDWRIAESTLLGVALIGGSPGAVWARQRYRHKTRKQPFTTLLDGIAVVHAGIAMGLAGFWLWSAVSPSVS